jgi:hypothetical protein
MSYVTRAGFLWKHGETYTFQDPPVAPPFCWIPTTTNGAVHLASSGIFIRSGADSIQPGVPTDVTISMIPASGTLALGVEEKAPSGWAVSNISNDGVFDPNTSTIRWGVFYDSNPRALKYTVTPPANVAAVGHLQGIVSADGAKQAVVGQQHITSVDDSKRPLIERCERSGNGVRLGLSGQAGQVSVLQRSNDLLHWQDVTTLFLPDGAAEITDDAGAGSVAYYRLQVR